MSDQEDQYYDDTMLAAEHAIEERLQQQQEEIAKAYNKGYEKGFHDGKEEGVKAIEELMKTYNENMGKFEKSLINIIKGE